MKRLFTVINHFLSISCYLRLMEIVKKYSNGEVTIIWQPKLCRHSGNCVKGLPKVFDYQAHPWIKPENAGSEELITQVNLCPSGALSWEKVNR